MGHRIVIENLDSKVTAAELTELLNSRSIVESVELAKAETPDAATRVAFVDARSARHGKALVAALDGQTHWGHVLKVKAMKTRGGGSGPIPGGAGPRSSQTLRKGDGRACSHGW